MVERLRIEGGESFRKNFLPYGQQWIEEEEIEAVEKVLRSSFLTQGPTIATFEQQLAKKVGVKEAVAFCNGTAALHGALAVGGIGEGDEVITTPLTFSATANAVRYCGGTVVFADVNPSTYTLCPRQVEKKITEKTKAILPVSYTGQLAEMDKLRELAKHYNLLLIEDGAHSLGATYKGKNSGQWADMTMFSFHPVKHITTGEGGAIVTDSTEYAEKLRAFRSHGIVKNDLWKYDLYHLGYNYRMTDIQAALGTVQLKKLEQFITRRREIAAKYDHAFSTISSLKTPVQHPQGHSIYHLYVLRFPPKNFTHSREEIYKAFHQENIGVQIHYIPVHTLAYYQHLGYKHGICPTAERLYEEIISLPLFPKMTDKDVEDVIHVVKKIVENWEK